MQNEIKSIEKYVRATNYLTATQIYLQNNFLLENKLTSDDIKPRLLGHWGTCPGINFIYANLNSLIVRRKLNMIFILGPGHGFPALQANLFLEGTLEAYYKEAKRTKEGIEYISKNFSWPYGFPSHSSPSAPGVIVEGGELGYALSTAYGAILDNPDLIATCVIGDGEAETGPTAAAWHLNKLIDPTHNGAVLPIVHINGYKISGPTIYGRMSDSELKSLFSGYGYEPHIVKGPHIYEKMLEALDRATDTIKHLQKEARDGRPTVSLRFPVILLRTPKGWTGIKKLKGEKLEDNYLSHQVIAKEAKTDIVERIALEKWMRSYSFNELFDATNGFINEIREIIPPKNFLMGSNRHLFGATYTPLALPESSLFSEDASTPGMVGSSSMRRIGLYLNEVIKLNSIERNFRIFSPDETYSNKIDDVFKSTSRSFVWPRKSTDANMTADGRVIEMLSEHSLQGLTQGYILTGRHAIFASYEAFIQVIASMADQYAKFLKVALEIEWRGKVPSLNYILTSSGWRQEHNGFSHQNPGFIDNMLQKQGCFVHVYFPPDANSALVCLERCMRSTGEINIIVAGKTVEARWLTPELAKKQLEQGLMTWDFASDTDPDIVLSGAGEYLTKEALAGMMIIREETPNIKMRFVSIMELSAIGIGSDGCHTRINEFTDYFTKDKPVIFNFHGYPQTLKQILFDYSDGLRRFSVHGYIENGSTTTPFDMHVRNETSRFHIAMEVFEMMRDTGKLSREKTESLVLKYKQKLFEHKKYIIENGVDQDYIENWIWKR